MENIFRAYDIRGVYGQEITLEFAEKIGKSFATYLGNSGTVALGRDARHGGQELQDALAAGLNSCGVNTIDVGLVPTPTLNYYCEREHCSAGVIISASHNPPEYNGIRFRKGDGAGYPECIPKVKEIYFNEAWKEVSKDSIGVHRDENVGEVIEDYLDYIARHTHLRRPLKVVIDPGNGAASQIASKLFEKLSCEVATINDFADGDFPGRSAYPNEKTLSGLQEEVRKVGADIGIAYDGDADRAVFVDDHGRVCSAEEVGALMVQKILAEKKGKVALNVDCSMSVEEAAEEAGGTVERIRVGDVFLADAVKRGAVFAMESSSHFVVPRYFHFDDGIAVSAYLCEIVAEAKRPFSDLCGDIPRYPVVRETLEVADDKKFKVIERVAERFSDKNPLTIDGVKIDHERGWTLVRASNTQPILRLTAEGKTEGDALEMMEELKAAVAESL